MKREKTVRLTLLGIFTALLIIQTFTPLGYIPIPLLPFPLTTIHISIIVAGITLGVLDGAIVGLIGGLLCILKAAAFPTSPTDPLFVNPMLSVVPRVLIGVCASLVFLGVMRLFKNSDKPYARMLSTAAGAIVGTLVNTVGVLTMFGLFYPADLGVADGSSLISIVLSTIIGINGIFEIVSAVVLAVPIVLAIYNLQKRSAH